MNGFPLPLGVARVFAAALALTFAASISSPARGQSIEPLLQYQGVLTSTKGELPVDGEVTLTFRLYGDDDPTERYFWEEEQTVEVSNGLFSAVLGMEESIPVQILAQLSEVWLGVEVGGETLLPMQRLLPTAYALHATSAAHALHAESADHADTAADADRLEGHEASDFLGTSGPQSIAHHGQLAPLTLTQSGVGSALEAEGVVRAESFKYSETQTRTVSYRGIEFAAKNFSSMEIAHNFSEFGVYVVEGPAGQQMLFKQVRLPEGARITEFEAEAGGANIDKTLIVQLYALEEGEPFAEIAAEVLLSPVNETVRISTTDIDPDVIVEGSDYVLAAHCQDWAAVGHSLQFNGVWITYEVDGP